MITLRCLLILNLISIVFVVIDEQGSSVCAVNPHIGSTCSTALGLPPEGILLDG